MDCVPQARHIYTDMCLPWSPQKQSHQQLNSATQKRHIPITHTPFAKASQWQHLTWGRVGHTTLQKERSICVGTRNHEAYKPGTKQHFLLHLNLSMCEGFYKKREKIIFNLIPSRNINCKLRSNVEISCQMSAFIHSVEEMKLMWNWLGRGNYSLYEHSSPSLPGVYDSGQCTAKQLLPFRELPLGGKDKPPIHHFNRLFRDHRLLGF